jgi:hypothetical protein
MPAIGLGLGVNFFRSTGLVAVEGALRGPSSFDETIADEAFYVPTISVGGVTVEASLFSESDTIYSHEAVLDTVTLASAFYNEGDSTFSVIALNVNAVTAPFISDDTDVFYAPVATGAGGLAAELFTESDTSYTQILTGSYTATAGLFTDDTEAFYVHLVTPGTVTVLEESTFTDTDTYYTQEIAAGAPALVASFFTDSDAFYAPTSNAVPFITSGATTTVAVGQSSVFYTLTASDPNSESLTYSITGDDAVWFDCDPDTGELTLAA